MKKNNRKSENNYRKEIQSWNDEDLEEVISVDSDTDSVYSEDAELVYSSDSVDDADDDYCTYETVEDESQAAVLDSSSDYEETDESECTENSSDVSYSENKAEYDNNSEGESIGINNVPQEGIVADEEACEEGVEADEVDSEENTAADEADSEEDTDTDEEALAEDTDTDEDVSQGDSDDVDEEDEEVEEEFDEEAYRRSIRRKRRIRNQIISYIVVLIFLAMIGGGIWYGATYVLNIVSEKKAQKEMETQIEDAIAQQEEEEVVIEAPAIDEPEPEEEETIEEVDYLGEMVSAVIADMTLEDKVAQLFFITPAMLTGVDAPTQAGETTRGALNEKAVGGLLFDKSNITDEDEQLRNLLSGVASMSKYELFLATVEPGGEDGSVYGSSLSAVPQVDSPEAIAQAGDSTLAYNAGTTISSYLSDYGFNLDISPDGSIITAEDSISSKYSYGAEDALVYDMVSQMIEGLSSGGINSCMTNFPGCGNIIESTAKGRVESEASADVLASQIVPYVSGVAAGAKLIMLNNVTYITADESGMPASLSKYMIGTMLRGNMGFEGVVLTAPLNEKAITEYYTSDEAALLAIAAGADMIYMPENYETAYEGVLAAVNEGTIPESRIDESLERIYRVKYADDVE